MPQPQTFSVRLNPVELWQRQYRDFLFLGTRLNFTMEAQTQSNWCWAATAKSVATFYWRFSNWTQCSVASQELGRTCCTSPVPGPCNVAWYLDRALTRTDNYVSISGPINYTQIRNELRNGRPVGVRIGWYNGGGHFMVIYGVYQIGVNQYLEIDDPIYGKSTYTLANFTNRYRNAGSWTHTYFTKRQRIVYPFKEFFVKDWVLKPVWEFKPLFRVKTNPQLSEKELQQEGTSLISPHPIYTLSADDLQLSQLMSKEPASVRVLETENDKLVAFYDVIQEKDSAQLLQASDNESYLSKVSEGIAVAERIADSEQQPELRSIEITPIYTEAIWVHYAENPEKNQVIPIRSFAMPLQEPMKLEQFLAQAQQELREIDRSDDLKGS